MIKVYAGCLPHQVKNFVIYVLILVTLGWVVQGGNGELHICYVEQLMYTKFFMPIWKTML